MSRLSSNFGSGFNSNFGSMSAFPNHYHSSSVDDYISQMRNGRLAPHYERPIHNPVPDRISPLGGLTIRLRAFFKWGYYYSIRKGDFFSAILTFLWLALLGLGIVALILNHQYDTETQMCIGDYGGISFDYQTWLQVYGWTAVGVIGGLMLAFVFSLAKQLRIEMEDLFNWLATWGYWFHVSWYVVGAILYFKTIHHSCPSGHIVHDFGLAVFIVQTINIVLLGWFGQRAYEAPNVTITI